MLFKKFDGQRQSLRDHVLQLAVEQNIDLKKQSLHEKFNKHSSEFVKQILIEHLHLGNYLQDLPYLNAFPNVYLQDSTKFKLPHSFKDHYPGYHQAGVSIQLVLDIKQRALSHIGLHPQTHNDVRESTHLDWIPPGALLIRDLGYFSIDGFARIEQQKAFFLSRLQPKSALFERKDGAFTRFDISKLLTKMKKHGLPYVDQQLFLSHQSKFPVRVCFFPVPKSIREKRLREKQKHTKSRGWVPSKEYALWSWFNVYITNADQSLMPVQDVPEIYRYRWQIELMFKTWKSFYHIEQLKSMKKERMECYLYAQLLKASMHIQLMNMYHRHFMGNSKGYLQISLIKFVKVALFMDRAIYELIRGCNPAIQRFIRILNTINPALLVKENKETHYLC